MDLQIGNTFYLAKPTIQIKSKMIFLFLLQSNLIFLFIYFFSRLVGIESKQEIESYYLTNGHQLCYVSLKDKACVDLPSE